MDFTAFKDGVGNHLPWRTCADYQAYNISTLGHLNADGLCAVARSHPSPP